MLFKRTLPVETSFTIKYDGLPDNGHAIDAVAFSKSLLATSEMFQISQKILIPQADLKRVQLKATPEGSIDAVLELVFVGVSLFTSTPATAMANAASIVPATWGALKRLRYLGQPAGAAQHTTINAETVTYIETVNIETLIQGAPRDQAQLLQAPDFRSSAAKTLDPLITGAAREMRILGSGKEPLESFDAEDALDIDLAIDSGKTLVSDDVSRRAVTAWGASFDQHRLRIGLDESTARWADVLDPMYCEFMGEPGAQVINGSELDVDLRIQVYQSQSGRRSSKWYIERVYDKPPTLGEF